MKTERRLPNMSAPHPFERIGEGDMHSIVRKASANIHLKFGQVNQTGMDIYDRSAWWKVHVYPARDEIPHARRVDLLILLLAVSP
ncbi:MAG: hypothetical protein U0V48_10340 [Anaerolineales bacterium]